MRASRCSHPPIPEALRGANHPGKATVRRGDGRSGRRGRHEPNLEPKARWTLQLGFLD